MQGSGTFAVEATIGTAIPRDGKLLVVNNGAYGARIAQIARRLEIDCTEITQLETEQADLRKVVATLEVDRAITHVALVHCETTTGHAEPGRRSWARSRARTARASSSTRCHRSAASR